MSKARIPILGFAAYSGTGKTTLLIKLLPMFKAHGIRVGIIKHAHHSFDIDQPGKDSYELRKAGAAQMLVASSQRWALMVEAEQEPILDELIGHLVADKLDLILVEGFKNEVFPKIELHRRSLNHPLFFPYDPHIIAIATDDELSDQPKLTTLDINNTRQILDFIIKYLSVQI